MISLDVCVHCRFDVREKNLPAPKCMHTQMRDVQRFSFQMNLNLCFSTPFVQLFSEQQQQLLHSIIILIYSHSFSSALAESRREKKSTKRHSFLCYFNEPNVCGCVCLTNSVENLYNILRWLEFSHICTHAKQTLRITYLTNCPF